MWFNPRVTENELAGVTTPTRGPRRRTTWLVVAACVAAVVAVVAVVAAVLTEPWAFGSGADDASSGPPVAAAAPRFEDVTTSAGLAHVYDGEFEFFVGGGVAALDCDDDGRTDLYFAGGARPASLWRNESRPGDVRLVREPSAVTDLERVTGAYPLDIDGDDVLDLVVLRHGANRILRGTGDCRFEVANDDLGIDGGDEWTTAFSATWEGDNDLPTLAFGNYLTTDRERCADSELVRPGADGGYGEPVRLTPGHCTLSVLFSDWDGSGRADLRVTNDRHYYREGGEQLWRIEEGEPPTAYTADDGWRPIQIWGMGIASHDLTGDGLPEVFLTSQGDNKLQTLAEGRSRPAYRDIALRAGATAQRPYAGGDVLPSTAWHPEFDDLNNDGYVDLFVTKGNVEAQPDHAMRDPDNLRIGQPDGTFTEAGTSAGIVGFERGRGAVVTDLDLDGHLDIVVVNRRTTPTIWHNLGTPSDDTAWIEIGLRQDAPNVNAVGAHVEVRVGDAWRIEEVTVGGGHAGGESGPLHVGLGAAESAEVRVVWPDGEVGPWFEVDAGARVIADRDAEPQISVE